MEGPTTRRRAGETSQEPPTNDEKATSNKPTAAQPKSSNANQSLSITDILRAITGLILLTAALSWFITGESIIWNWRQAPTVFGAAKRWFSGPFSLTDDELSLYNGTDPAKPIYVGLNGSIYDVSASSHTYGPGGSYSFFAGRDATRGFITGCFQEDLTPDLRGLEEMFVPIDDADETPALTKGQLKVRKERDLRVARKRITEGIDHWAQVFRGETGRPYFYVGTIRREEGWLEKLPKRELCEAAREARPMRKDV